MQSLTVPRSFGPYTLLRRLAVGGMAEIYVAKTRGLGGFEKLAALKLIHPHLSVDPQFVRMLIDEAKILVLLTHANIAQVFDLGCVDERFYIAMEYVDGVDAQGLVRAAVRLGPPLPISVCCFIAAELLNGLEYVHRKCDESGRPLGIVHRDISPQNVMISRAGEVKLVDFGIAKTNLRVEQTEVGVIKGKYGYMSPEQAWADPTDHRSDVFSAGVMLYELLTGSALYTAKTVAELIAKVRRAEVPPPDRQRADIPRALSQIVMKALAVEPSERFQSALAMGEALRDFLFQSAHAFNGTRLGRYVVEVLEADEKLTAEQKQLADETGGLRALTRDEFLRPDVSVMFSLPELGAATRSDHSERTKTGRELRDGEIKAMLSLAPTIEARPAAAPPKAAAPAEPPSDDDATELWTARWFAQQGTSLRVAPEIRMQGDTGDPTERRLAAWKSDPPGGALPTLSWPPSDSRSRDSGEFVNALVVPPRGEDPSLGPLPRLPAVPNFRGVMRQQIGRWELLWLIAFIVLGAFVAVLAWESTEDAALEIISSPPGASVLVDGAVQPGVTPLRLSGLRRGARYRIRLELRGHRAHQRDFEAPRGTERHEIALQRE